VKDQLLLKGHDVTSGPENNRNLTLRILFGRMERMRDVMLLKAIGRLGEIGALDVPAATATLMPEQQTPMDAKDTGLLLEAIEHAAHYFSNQAKIERDRNGG
jgi:hypothetical protein